LTPSLCQPEEVDICGKLLLATVNVGTLHYDNNRGAGVSCKVVEVLKQFEEKGIQIIGIQEGRAAKTQCVETGPFTRFIAAGKQGHLGVELWIGELGKRIHTDFNGTKDACVWHQNSRMLIPVARCNFGSIAMDIAVLYAPPRGRGHEELQQWWNEPEHVLQQRDRNILISRFSALAISTAR
jgi:exonuclease III